EARLAELREALSVCDARAADARRASAAHQEAAEVARSEAPTWEDELMRARERYRETASQLVRGGEDWPKELLDTPVDLSSPLPDPSPDSGPLFELAAVTASV